MESLRTIDRFRVNKLIEDSIAADKISELNQLFDYIGFLPLNDIVLKRASEPHPTAVATLDSIHLASAYLWRETCKQEIIFLTYDRQLAVAARVLGFAVKGVIF